MVGYWGSGNPEVEELLQEKGGPRTILWTAKLEGPHFSFASPSFSTAATVISGSIGVVALILLLVGLLSMTLKKWRHESELSKLVLDLKIKR